MMKVKNIIAGLPVKNLAKSAEWYKDVFSPKEELVPSDGVIEYKIGDMWIMLFEGKAVDCDNCVNFEVENLEKEYKRLQDTGIIKNEAIEEVPDVVRYFSFKDPDGNNLCLVEVY